MDVRRIDLSIAVAAMGLAFAAASGLAANASATASGGVFRYSLMSDVEDLDPALAGEQVAWEIAYATCSMLVNYPDAPSPRGARLVPDGAAAMPTVSRDGRTYTFRVRNGRRFSDGTPITAGNFAWALLRVLHPGMRSPAAVNYADIEGAREFTAGRAEDVRGLSVLAGNRLRIRLERRAADLLARLAMPSRAPSPLVSRSIPPAFAPRSRARARTTSQSGRPGRRSCCAETVTTGARGRGACGRSGSTSSTR